VELAVIALGRSIDMVPRARSLKGITVPVPTNITNSIQAVSEIGLLRSPWSGADGPLSGPRGVTVVVRWIPLVPAACGMRVARGR
jgi:hypothetical protein